MITEKICSVNGCSVKHYAKSFCKRHWAQMNRHGKIISIHKRSSNAIIIKGNVAEILLYNKEGKEKARVIIDSEDVEKVKKYEWSLKQKGYVVATVKGKLTRIAQVILQMQDSEDFKDRDLLNNRKSNLKIYRNDKYKTWKRKKHKNNTSGYLGVFKNQKRWVAKISINNERIYLGSFKKKTEAATAYNKAAKKYFGKFARLNAVLFKRTL